MRNGSKHTCSTSRIRRTCARMHARPTAPAAIFASQAYLTTGRRCSFGSSSRMCTAPPTACTTKSPSNMCLSVSGFVEHSESSVKPCDEFISYRNRSNKIKTSRLLLEKIKSSRLCSWDFPLYFHANHARCSQDFSRLLVFTALRSVLRCNPCSPPRSIERKSSSARYATLMPDAVVAGFAPCSSSLSNSQSSSCCFRIARRIGTRRSYSSGTLPCHPRCAASRQPRRPA